MMRAPIAALLLLAACAPAPARLPTSSSGTATDAAMATPDPRAAVRPGIETFLADVTPAFRGKRVGLITNNSAMTGLPRGYAAGSDPRKDGMAVGY